MYTVERGRPDTAKSLVDRPLSFLVTKTRDQTGWAGKKQIQSDAKMDRSGLNAN